MDRRRTAPNRWQRLTTAGLTTPLKGDLTDAGFDDIDGFADDDIYACGPKGALWHFDGKRWSQRRCPTTADFQNILCAPDGRVYLTTDSHEVWIVGDDGRLRLRLDLVVVSTDDGVYEVSTGTSRSLPFGAPAMRAFSHLAAGDGVLVIAGADEAFLYDGARWKKIFQL